MHVKTSVYKLYIVYNCTCSILGIIGDGGVICVYIEIYKNFCIKLR